MKQVTKRLNNYNNGEKRVEVHKSVGLKNELLWLPYNRNERSKEN